MCFKLSMKIFLHQKSFNVIVFKVKTLKKHCCPLMSPLWFLVKYSKLPKKLVDKMHLKALNTCLKMAFFVFQISEWLFVLDKDGSLLVSLPGHGPLFWSRHHQWPGT